MSSWEPELTISNTLLTDGVSLSGAAAGAHPIFRKKLKLNGKEVFVFYRMVHGDIKTLIETCVDVTLSLWYRYLLGNAASESRLVVDGNNRIIGWPS